MGELCLYERYLKGTIFGGNVLALAVGVKKASGLLSKFSSSFPTLAFDARDMEVVVSGCLMTHPCDRGCFGTLLNWDTLGSGDSSAVHRRSVIGYASSEFFGDRSVATVKV